MNDKSVIKESLLEEEKAFVSCEKLDYLNSVPMQLKDFLEYLKTFSSTNQKIEQCLVFMRVALSDKPLRFKDFWEVKHICSSLFKEGVSDHHHFFWESYIELSTEANHLKSILDERSSFAIEQIDLAIQGVEGDLEKYSELVDSASPLNVPDNAQSLINNKKAYLHLQMELNLLSGFAVKINGFRKELMKTEMRVRDKNNFFSRLSKAGDKIFPRRKELIKKISTLFLEDVLRFTQNQFIPDNLLTASTFKLREEIKALQLWAKELTLDTATFSAVRSELSKSWDTLKEYETVLRKEIFEKKEVCKKNIELVLDKVRLLEQNCLAENFTMAEASKQSHEILDFMQRLELTKEDGRFLRDKIYQARAPIEEKLDKVTKEREKIREEAQKQRSNKIEDLRQKIQEVLGTVEEKTIETLIACRDELQKQMNALPLTPAEKELFECSIKEIRDSIIDKKEKAIATLSDEEKNSLENLEKMLEEWKNQKNEIRKQIDSYRKTLSGFGFDFEQAMRYRDLIDGEKDRLNKAQAAIDEVEFNIEKLKNS